MKFEKADQTRMLEAALSKLPEGETVTYGDLERLAGVRLLGPDGKVNGGRGYLDQARKAVESDGILFETVRGVGVIRKSRVEPTGLVSKALRSTRRRFKRISRALESCVDYHRMNPEQKARHFADASVANVMIAATAPKTQRAIEAKCAEAQETLSLGRTIGFLEGSNKK